MSTYQNPFGNKLPQFPSAAWLGTDASGVLTNLGQAGPSAGDVLTFNGAGLAPTWQPAGGGGSVTIAGDSGSTTGTSFTFTGGTSGAVFTMATGTMTESFNYLSLPTTTSTNGQIKINGTPVLHTFGTNNTFVGEAGNFTLSGSQHCAVGSTALHSATSNTDCTAIGFQSLYYSTGNLNSALGSNSGVAISSGTQNCAFGRDAMYGNGSHNVSGSNNTAVGYGALFYPQTTAASNTAIGALSLHTTTGSFNVAIGDSAGSGYTSSESSNIVINATGTTGESNTCRIGAGTGSGDGQLTDTYLYGTVHADTLVTVPTTTSTAGQYQINGQAVLHTFGTNNTFVGVGAGNFGLSGNGHETTAVGTNALHSLTTGQYNCAYGFSSQSTNQTHSFNTSYGTYSLSNVTGGAGNVGSNTAIGYAALYNLGAAKFNVGIGANCGSNYTSTESSNITIGSGVAGTTGESNTCRIGAGTGSGDGQLTDTYLYGTVHADTILALPTTSSTAGQITWDGKELIHFYGTFNTFIGGGTPAASSGIAGNFTMSGTRNCGIGALCMNGMSSGSYNMGMGVQTLGAANCSNSVAIGHAAGYNALDNSVAIGYQALGGNTAGGPGANCTAIGYKAGNAYVGGVGASNICIGYETGIAGESNTLHIGNATGTSAGNLNKAIICGIYNKSVGATAGMVVIDSTDVMGSVPYVPSTAWTPVLNFGGATTGITYGTQTGTYCRTGGVVTFTLRIVLTSKGSATGNATITGIPVAAAADTACSIHYSELSAGSGRSVYVALNGSTITFYADDNNLATENILQETNFSNTSAITISGSYLV